MDGSMFVSLLADASVGLLIPINGDEVIAHSLFVVVILAVVTSVIG